MIFKKKCYSHFVVTEYLENLFYDAFYTPERVYEAFLENKKLLIDIYFYLFDRSEHFDYSGKYLSYFLSKDDDWLVAFGGQFKKNLIEQRKSYGSLEKLWDNEYCFNIFDYLFEVYIEYGYNKKLFYYDDPFMQFLTSNHFKPVLKERMTLWFKHQITLRKNEPVRLMVLFAFVSNFDEKARKDLLLFFIENNDDIEVFKDIKIEPDIYSWSGSQLPLINKRIEFLLAIVQELEERDSIRYFDHIKILQDRIKRIKEYMKEEEVDELIREAEMFRS